MASKPEVGAVTGGSDSSTVAERYSYTWSNKITKYLIWSNIKRVESRFLIDPISTTHETETKLTVEDRRLC